MKNDVNTATILLSGGTNGVSGGDISITGTLSTDTISEKTSGTGVTIDSVLLKDNNVTAHTINAQNYSVGGTNFISASRQGNFRDLEVKDNANNSTILLSGGTSGVSGGDISITGTLSTDTISEKTSGSGVTIDSVLLKDGDISAGSLTLTGDLSISGTTTTINSTTVAVADSMFKYAKDNTTNNLDIGFYGQYVDSSTTKYSGMYYSASDSKFHIFKDQQAEPTTTVNTSGTGYTKGDLVCGNIDITTLTANSSTGNSGQILSSTGSGLSWIDSSTASQWTTSSNDIYYNTGNVGIGDSSPSYKLDVTGDINLTGSLRINGVVQTFGGGGTGDITTSLITGASNSNNKIKENSTYGWEIHANYGSTAGSHSRFALQFRDDSYSTSNYPYLGNYNGGYAFHINGVSGNAYYCNTSLQHYFSGTVGIGNTSPSYPLDVVGGIKASGGLYSFNSNTTASAELTLRKMSAGQDSKCPSILFQGEVSGSPNVVYEQAQIYSVDTVHGGTWYGGSLRFATKPNDSSSTSTSIDRMTIHATGNIGVGITTPEFPVQISYENAAYSTEVASGGTINIAPVGPYGVTQSRGRISWGMNLNNRGGAGQYNQHCGSGIKFTNYHDSTVNHAGIDNRWVGIASVSEADYSNKVGISFWTCNSSGGVMGAGYDSTFNNTGTGTPQEQMRLSNKGNLGIGTMYPHSKLHLYSTVAQAQSEGHESSTHIPFITLQSNPSTDCNYDDWNPVSIDFKMANDTDDYTNIARISAVTAPIGRGSGNHATGAGEGSNALIFSTSDSTTLSEAMRIDYNGKVGMGTKTPSYDLDVAGDINLTGSLRINGVAQSFGGGSSSWNVSGNNIYYNSGNVAVGSSLSPQAKLEVNVTDYAHLSMYYAQSEPVLRVMNTSIAHWQATGQKCVVDLMRMGHNTSHYGPRAWFTLGRYAGGTGSNASTKLNIDLLESASSSALTTIMTLQSNGKVGISNSSPSYPLDVAGDINLTGSLRINGVAQSFGGGSSAWTTSGNNVYWNGSGKVGIGITTPEFPLQISYENAAYGTEVASGGTINIAPLGPYGVTQNRGRINWGMNLNSRAHCGAYNQHGGSGIKFTNYCDSTVNYSGVDNRWVGIASVSEANYSNRTGIAFWTSNSSSTSSTSGYPDYTYNQGTGTPQEQMRLSNAGYLGIGTQYPFFPLDVGKGIAGRTGTYWSAAGNDGAYFITNGKESSSSFGMTSTSYSYSSWSNDQARAGDLDSTGVTGISNVTLSAHFKYSIYCSDGGFCSSSDERIKHDISDVNDNLALDVIRKIEPKYYNYIDKFSRHQYRTIGFIAQQVNEYFPEAIKFTTKCIPNVMKNLTDITWTAFTDTEEDTVKYKLTCTLIDVKTGEIISDINGINYKFYVNDDSNQSDEKELLIPGNSDNTFIFAKKWDNIFCYGAEVNDFHTLEKEKYLHYITVQFKKLINNNK